MNQNTPIYVATVLLERNRWTDHKRPTFAVSEWGERFAEVGFDGVELWENHYRLADEAERAAIAAMPCPVVYYNTYAGFGDDGAAARQAAAEHIARLGAAGCKYNLGQDPAQRETEMRNLRAWVEALPETCLPLCECHPGTILEDPRDAHRFFREADLSRSGIIVHAMGGEQSCLDAWFDRFGADIRHLHLRVYTEPDLAGRLAYLDRLGFDGSMSIEFVEGVGEPGETIEQAFGRAVADLNALRAALT